MLFVISQFKDKKMSIYKALQYWFLNNLNKHRRNTKIKKGQIKENQLMQLRK